jgi:hypothetical protein
VGEERRENLVEEPKGVPSIHPEGGKGAVMDGGAGNGSMQRKTMENNLLEEEGGRGTVTKVPVVEAKEPHLPRQLFVLVKLMDEVHEQHRVLLMEVPHAEATNLIRQTNLIPSNKTVSSRAFILAGPKKGAAPLINRVNHTTW